jgi:DNA-binding transcriptional LysR family regulator
MLIEAAVSGLGVICQPTFIAHQAIAEGNLEIVLPDVSWGEMAACVVFPQGRPLPVRARQFIDILVEHFRAPNIWD